MAATGYVRGHPIMHRSVRRAELIRIDFSNTLTKGQIEDMASVDEFEVVKEIQEYFADFLAQGLSHFTLTPAALADGGEGPPNVSTKSKLRQA